MPATLADRLSRPLSPLDGPNLALQDRLNDSVPWLWWPIGRPSPTAPMRPAAHGLYALHAWAIVRVLRLPRRPAVVAVAVLSWAAFSGAWDRRAAVAEPGQRSGSPGSSASESGSTMASSASP